MTDFNTKFGICSDFINDMKKVIESDHDRWDNFYLERSVIFAECDLMEMELEALDDAKEYDSVLNGNAFRKSRNRKARQNGKRNADKAKRYHRSDRKHGKPVPQSDKKYWDEQSGTFHRWDEKEKDFDTRKKPIVHQNRKTFRDRLNASMSAREQEYILFPDPIEELWNAYWLYIDAECRLDHKANEPLFEHRTQKAYEEAIKEWEKLSKEVNDTFLIVDSLLYSLGLNWGYFEN